MAIDAQTLLGEAKCYECYGPLTLAQMLALALERRILLSLDPDANVSANALLEYAKCDLCFTEGSTFDAMEMALLDQISQA
jgi:hypothetical protein